MSVSDSPVTEVERRLLIAEARKYLSSPSDPSDGVGHGGLLAEIRARVARKANDMAEWDATEEAPSSEPMVPRLECLLAILGER